jgi:hypothetical protein
MEALISKMVAMASGVCGMVRAAFADIVDPIKNVSSIVLRVFMILQGVQIVFGESAELEALALPFLLEVGLLRPRSAVGWLRNIRLSL